MASGDKNYNIATESGLNSVIDKLGDFSSEDTVKSAIVALANEISFIKSSIENNTGGITEDSLRWLKRYTTDGSTTLESVTQSGSYSQHTSAKVTLINSHQLVPKHSGYLTVKFTGSQTGSQPLTHTANITDDRGTSYSLSNGKSLTIRLVVDEPITISSYYNGYSNTGGSGYSGTSTHQIDFIGSLTL